MITEQDQKILDTVKRLRATMATKGWKDIEGYVAVRVIGLKNLLARIDLAKETASASQKQGEIKGLESIIHRINNLIVQAKKIEDRENKNKKEK